MPYLKIGYGDPKPTLEALYFPDNPIVWLDACHDAIGCSLIETVPTVLSGIYLVIDQEAKLCDGWQNRINHVASLLYDSDWDSIVGNAILAKIDGEDFAPLTYFDFFNLGIFLSDFFIEVK